MDGVVRDFWIYMGVLFYDDDVMHFTMFLILNAPLQYLHSSPRLSLRTAPRPLGLRCAAYSVLVVVAPPRCPSITV
jgi:hypothetical protein